MAGWRRVLFALGAVVVMTGVVEACGMPTYEFNPAGGAGVDSGFADANPQSDATSTADVVVEAQVIYPGAPPCSEGKVVLVAGKPHCYFFAPEPGLCPTVCPEGSHLATIPTLEEDKAITDDIRPSLRPLIRQFLIGLQANEPTSDKAKFTWLTGEPTEIQKWGESRPNGTGTCVIYRFDKEGLPQGFWDDREATKAFDALCERDPLP